jgi:hypothetical protein
MTIHEFAKPIPVVVEDGKEGFALYVESSGMFENDVWCVVHCEGGVVRHYASDQVRVYLNATFGIRREGNS